ncbi:GDP-fucose transporter 1 [Leucoagaricus sp. SymC.cos]|nr:GDP-fucose transporter 1 [Leucoagaricus sp. SymC.cos]
MPFPAMNRQTFQVAGVVMFYMSAALIMVFVNKAVLNNSPDLPLLFLLIQLLVAVVLLHASAAMSTKIEIPKLDREVAKKLVPVVSVNIIGLVFNTLCLRGVEASFFQIARGLVLPLTILVSCLHTRKIPTAKVIAAAVVVTFGFALGVAPSKNLPTKSIPSALSLIYGVLSSLFIAIHAVLIKSSLPYCNNSTIQLAWWTNAGSAIMLLPFVVLNGEFVKCWDKFSSDSTWDFSMFLWGTLLTGVFGFLLCIAGLLSIKVTSPITHMFSSAARSVLQTLLGVCIFQDVLNVERATSILVILVGTMYYTWIKSTEMPPKPQPRPGDAESDESSQHLVFDADEDSELEELKSSQPPSQRKA